MIAASVTPIDTAFETELATGSCNPAGREVRQLDPTQRSHPIVGKQAAGASAGEPRMGRFTQDDVTYSGSGLDP